MQDRYPVETQIIADHGVADDILDHVLSAASAAIENELKAIGEPVWWPTTSCLSRPRWWKALLQRAPGIFLRRSRH
jgi:hypothetical protein